jgi:hypothetical protein
MRARVLCALVALPALTFGWGSGHDVVGKALAERLPEPWRSRLQGEALKQFCADNHYPDARMEFAADARVTPGEVGYLAARKMTNSGQLHSDEGRGFSFALLVRALRENRPESALLWLGALAHSTADMAACNHDPIVHLATYGWSDPGWAFRLPSGRALTALDLGWVAGVPEAKDVWEKRLALVAAADSGKDAEEAVLDVMLAGPQGVSACAPVGVPIIRDAAAWCNAKSPERARSLAESLSQLGCWAVERVLRDFLAAERLAKTGANPDVTAAVLSRYRAAFETFTATRPFDEDSLTKGLTAPISPDKPCMAVLAEPAWRMNDGMFGFNDRVLAAQAVTSLRRRGTNAALADVRAFMACHFPVDKVPIVLVFAQKVSAYYTLQPKALTEQLVAYRKAGGKIVWVGGAPPDAALCDFPKEGACRADVGRGYAYSWTRLPVGTNAYPALTLTVGDGPARKLAHTPNFQAGWQIPSNVTFFSQAAGEWMLPLATVSDGASALPVGGAWPKRAPTVAYLPTYALYPYLWTGEAPPLVPFELELDSLGRQALDAALSMLGVANT